MPSLRTSWRQVNAARAAWHGDPSAPSSLAPRASLLRVLSRTPVQSVVHRRLASTLDTGSLSRPRFLTPRKVLVRFLAFSVSASLALLATKQTTHSDHQTTPAEPPSGQKLISYEEVQKHRSREDCWVVIDGNVYDVTDFLDNHPGGGGIILANAGKDATKIFKPLHPPDALEVLDPSQHLGPVDPLTMPAVSTEPTEEEQKIEEARRHLPSVGSMLLLADFEEWAEKVLSGTGWNYYKSASDTEDSAEENANAFKRYYFRPRILRNVTEGSLDTTYMGIHSTLPIFVSPAAMAKLGHPLGEVNITKGAGECGIVQGISINASCSLDEIMQARKEDQKVFFQIYLNKDRKASEVLLHKVTALGATAVIFTVDAAYRSKRTRDVRAKDDGPVGPLLVVDRPGPRAYSLCKAPMKDGGPSSSSSPKGVSRAISGYQDTNLTWDDIAFIRKHTTLPIIVKGIQCVEDVELCAEAGVEGVILSNHGGRQCNFSPAPIDILYEIRVRRPDLFDKVEIMMDGGVRSGSDVIKALALGAKAVGLGRPFLYANGTHGQEGVVRVCEILAEEMENTMRNCGVTKIADLRPEMVGPKGPWVGSNRPPYVA
ncbi:L-lactate dehydrogenase (cytochrome), partial [Tremellales sp. Uapishka_1]